MSLPFFDPARSGFLFAENCMFDKRELTWGTSSSGYETLIKTQQITYFDVI
jgi:hypothetical protein